ncbi:NFX1-type zinc finger-containing protein 1-like isoform X2 [Bradysia coprophila]|uniref:NFX1-type zinc finger-containing protein 1-like isoform X2 n=1 Tax=Bradysia coprophila TaxID=38358 RepID=UPI00187D9C15|nr:NFX1-type zinc finger-containing protein 1-like isoform X2 [Bradysia coprophila]
MGRGFDHSNGNRNNSGQPFNAFGFKRLAEFLTQTNDEVLMALDKSTNNFLQNLRKESNEDTMILLILIVGEKICGETSLHEVQNNLVALSIDPSFLEKILKFTSQIPSLRADEANSDITVDRSHTRILNALSAFYGRLCARMPAFAADKLLPYIQGAHNISELLSLKGLIEKEKSIEIESRFDALIQEIELTKEAARQNSTAEFQTKMRKRQQITPEDRDKLYQITPDDDFRNMSIIPSKEEILSDEEPFLRPNLIDGKYPSALTYLDVQFRLLREDFLAVLRESVKKYFLMNATDHDSKNHRPHPGTVRIYRDVKLHKVNCTTDVTLFTMKFSTINLKRVKWQNSKRLLTGSLLILTPDRFKNIYFATVGRRDEKKLPQGLIDIKWEGIRPDTYNNVTFLMLECEVYFESYRHTLKALQDMAKACPPLYDRPRLQTYRMSKYIVDVTTNVIPPPEYLLTRDWSTASINFEMILQSNQEAINLRKAKREQEKDPSFIDDGQTKVPELQSFKINPLELVKWPSATELGMDSPQYVAFQSAITQELAIIQGPPGTGKTYIGLQIMKLLLANSLGTSDSPILVVCYTNHALDQFLEGIIAIMNSLNINPYGKLVRVGGQSKVEEIQQYNIRNIRDDYLRQRKYDDSYAQLRNRSRHQLILLQDHRSDLKSLFSDLSCPEGVVNFSILNAQMQKHDDEFSLHSIIDGELAEIFFSRNGAALFNWLQMNNHHFEFDHFSAENILKRWFRVTATGMANGRQPEVSQEVETPEAENEDEELRRILDAHRMEEEILEEDRKYKAERLEYHFCYRHGEKFKSAEDELFAEHQIARQQNNHQRARYLEGRLYELTLQKKKFNNQCAFMKAFLRNYKDGRINLPNVTPDSLANDAHSVWQHTISEKWAIYFYFIDKIKKYLLQEIIKIEAVIMDAQKKMDEVKNQGDGFILQQAQVVGMTTTGAAKYNTVLRMMQSKIVIVEEAAEVLESHIITSLTEHCEHLILIGDHQQLRPPTTVYKLAKDYKLDISLFERLIKNNIKWQYLRAQHRMRPEICKLLVPTIYRDLENHSSVHFYPPVKGFLKNIFFINHSDPEKADNDSMTKSNEYEARYITQLCRYLMLQGYQSSQITILTTYIGQMFLIKRLQMDEGDTCRGVRVTVVDNFQGEENDIILLSLVRSNDENKIGFLRTDNRICVALSRAKQGLYIVGNMDCLVNSPSTTWKKISDELAEQESIGPGLKLRCQNHKEIIEINSPEEFRQKSPEGGCTKMCPGVLPRCDHACRKICHVVDSEHHAYECKEKCERHCPDAEKHRCPNVCSMYPCPPCRTAMRRTLPCDHVIELPCHIDILTSYSCIVVVLKSLECEHIVPLPCCVPAESHRCTIKVDKSLECGHTKMLPCHVPATNYQCVEIVTKDLDCGHKAPMKCIDDASKFNCRYPTVRLLSCGHEQTAPCNDDIPTIKCETQLDKVKPDCNHEVKIPCHLSDDPKKWMCLENCDTRLNCGHQCVRKCHNLEDRDHLNYICTKVCARSCINDHSCKKKHPCHEICDPCKISTKKTLDCGHDITVKCFENIANRRCEESCQREALSCGHKCLKKCNVPCEPCTTLTEKKSIDCPHTFKVPCDQRAEKSICDELVPSDNFSLCGHIVKVPCRIADTCSPEDCLQYCRRPCGYKFDYDGGCGHTCEGDCASCCQGRIHVKCNSKCKRILACGHVCKSPCSSLCPPCSDACILQCKHSKCKKTCGEPCIDCKEPCKWSCEHSQCKRKCSEMCNRNCCDEPCKKKIKCGHDCIGSCGEPCPPFCRICEKDIVQEDFFGFEDEEDARFVYLENCGHIIHRESMDTWMAQKTEEKSESTQITVKRCPKCQTIITKSVRYGNIIKKQFKEVLRIRKKIFGNDRTQKDTQLVVARKIQCQSFQQECQFENVREFLEKNLFVMKKIKVRHGHQMDLQLLDVDQYTFESLHNIVSWWEEAERNMKPNEVTESPRTRQVIKPLPKVLATKQDLIPDSRTELLNMYKQLFGILLSRKLPLSTHEINDFDQEFAKIHDVYRLGLRRGIDNFDSFAGALEMHNVVHRHLMQKRPYDEDRQKETQNALTKLEEIIKVGWVGLVQKRTSDARKNREQIFAAMGFRGNHWYSCTKGHLYVVADCGALNQSGTCPECRSTIGRGSQNIAAVRDESAIQQQINSVVDIFPETYYTPTFQDRFRNADRGRIYNKRDHNRRGRRN